MISSSVNLSESEPGSFQTLAASGRIKLDRKVVQVSGVRGSTGRGIQFVIQNVGAGKLKLGTDAFTITGPDAAHFAIVGGSLPRTLNPGKRGAFYVALKAASNAPTNRVLTATIQIKQSGAASPSAALALRGIATTGEGADKEPSLARILDLFQYSINVGDTSPNTTYLDLNGGPTDQITAPRFVKASGGPITIDTIAQYAVRTNTVASRVGIYEPGTPDTRKTLFSLAGIDAQTVNPVENGSATFDPGSKQFSLWAEAPTFIDDSEPRIIYGEENLNTWESNAGARNKVRVYPLKEGGKVVANAYVVAFEEYTLQNDQNDVVFVLRNVTPSKSQPEIGLISLTGSPDADRIALNRIGNLDPNVPNAVQDTGKVRVVNTGNRDLIIDSVTLNAAGNVFQMVGAPTTPVTLRRGGSLDLTVKFVAQSGDLRKTSITIKSSDRDEPIKTINVTGFFQTDSEMNSQGFSQEPTLAELFDAFGFRTQALVGTQVIDENGKTSAVGDEVLADAWAAADAAKPVFVQELAGFHAQGQIDQIAWYPTGKPYYGVADPRYPGPALNGERNIIFENNESDGQRFFPRKKDETTAIAKGSFMPGTQTFGFRVQSEFSDDELNNQAPGDQGGHHFRFYPARDENGAYIPDTWLVAMDFASINFDYNDHLLLVKNLRPADRPAAVDGVTGNGTAAGNVFEWADVPGAKGYAVLRSNKAGGPYVRISDDVLTTSNFTDTSTPSERTRYYKIVAVANDGDYGMPAYLSVARPKA